VNARRPDVRAVHSIEEASMYAVVVHVRITADNVESSREQLRSQVIPRIRQAPGFVKGYWTASADQTSGDSIVVFKTKHDAEQASGMVRNGPTPQGVTLEKVEVREVVAEA
jgi:hypothetical protein